MKYVAIFLWLAMQAHIDFLAPCNQPGIPPDQACIIVEPLDVPAIQIEVPPPHPCNIPTGTLACVTGPEKHWTCGDKFRVLEHDEYDPPHWWCRKVQP